jgi:tetratricopeptide (TPR) repeat protein
LGVTFYEQRDYEKSLNYFNTSRKIASSCPLTQWNLAGALGALGRTSQAIKTYNGLLESRTTFAEDACWESKEWTDAIKADCVYRLGACFERQGKKRIAEDCYRQYIDLLLVGIDGLYSMEDVTGRIRALQKSANGREGKIRKAVRLTLKASGTRI